MSELGPTVLKVSIILSYWVLHLLIYWQGTYDEVLSDIRAEIEDRFPVGQCRKHEKKRCFVHGPTGNHFDLNEARITSWASKIVCNLIIPSCHNSNVDNSQKAGQNGVDFDHPPIGSHLFKPGHALKDDATGLPAGSTTGATSATPTPNASLSNQPTTAPGAFSPFHSPPNYIPSFFPMMNPISQLPYLFPSMPAPPNSPTAEPSSRGRKRTIDVRSSSPDYDFNSLETLSIEDFCSRYNLDTKFVDGLRQLQFTPGDILALVPKQEYIDAGFTTLSWHRAVQASKDFNRSHRK